MSLGWPSVDPHHPALLRAGHDDPDDQRRYALLVYRHGRARPFFNGLPDEGTVQRVALRLYTPLQPWFDKTWKPGEFELVNKIDEQLADGVYDLPLKRSVNRAAHG